MRSPVETPLQEESEDHHDEGQRQGEGEVAELGAARPLYVTPGGVGRQPHPLVPEQPRQRGHGEGGPLAGHHGVLLFFISSAAKLGLKSVQLWWNLISQYFVLCSGGILYTHLQY